LRSLRLRAALLLCGDMIAEDTAEGHLKVFHDRRQIRSQFSWID
jgi:hypothetical protein